jgi:hypothetical protein
LFEHDLFGKPVSAFPDHASGKAKESQGIAGVEIIFSQKNDTRFDRNYDKMAVTSNGHNYEWPCA